MKANQNTLVEGLRNTTDTRKWDDHTYWKGVRIGQCVSCKRQGKDVLRNGLCWVCDSPIPDIARTYESIISEVILGH